MSRDIWLTSDTHLNHANIIKYCDRPFRDVVEMNEAIIEGWNSVVKPQDICYHLGDVYFAKHWTSKIVEDRAVEPPKDVRETQADYMLSRLNGSKRLILGNHDEAKDLLLHKHFKKIMLWRKFREFGLLLTHVPVHPAQLEDYESPTKGMVTRGMEKNVHGHIHDKILPDPRYVNVCVEQTNYVPVHIETLRAK